MKTKKLETKNSSSFSYLLKDQSGQLLIYVLIAVVVASVVTFGIAYRSLVSTRRSSVSSRSVEALHAAESCAEVALAMTDSDLQLLVGAEAQNIDLDADADPRCSFEVSADGGSSSLSPLLVKKDEVREISLTGYTGSQLTLLWNNENYNEDAMLMIVAVYLASGNYEVQTDIFDGTGGADCGEYASGSFQIPLAAASPYEYQATIDLPVGVRLVRVHALCTDTHLLVQGDGNNLPAQGFVITASGFAGDSLRKVRVTRTNPQLPAVFDYVLFSKSASTPLSK